ncbi:MAG: cysteine--tRNA ligase [Planctomycetota bacterium]
MGVLRLHNTMTRREEVFVPADPACVTFYSCGPTVYDDSHIGNFRSFLAADVLRRWIESPLCALQGPDGAEHRGPREVVHVMNITDVGHMTDDAAADGGGEDKMAQAGQRLLEAKKSGKLPPDASVDPSDPHAIAEFYAQRFIEDGAAVGLKVAIEGQRDASLLPRATAHVPQMIEMITRLIERGAAYAVGEPGEQAVYFDVDAFERYGALSNNTIEALSVGAGGRVSETNQSQKKHPADFMLWKADASHLMRWPSPWGEGYPGWHIECSAMSLARLAGLREGGATFDRPDIDLHSGGEDNIFPHHECEVAQSCAATGAPTFARHWFHARFLFVEGEKMSKRKGNFFTVRQLLGEGHEPAAIRLELIGAHYRNNLDFRAQGLKDSARTVERWRRFVAQGEASESPGEPNAATRDAVTSRLQDDLNIAGAIGEINKWIGATERPTRADAELMRTFDGVLGVLDLAQAESAETSIGVFVGVESDERVVALLEERAAARASKDFATSDRIRDELSAMGLAIKDVAGGKVEVTRA